MQEHLQQALEFVKANPYSSCFIGGLVSLTLGLNLVAGGLMVTGLYLVETSE